MEPSQQLGKPARVHPELTAGAFAAALAGAVWANLAWAGITVPDAVIAADTALLYAAVRRFWPSLS